MARPDDVFDLVVVPVADPTTQPAEIADDEDVIDVGKPRRTDRWAARLRTDRLRTERLRTDRLRTDRWAARLRSTPLKVRLAAGVVVAALVVGGYVGWRLTRSAPPQAIAAPAAAATSNPLPDSLPPDLGHRNRLRFVDAPPCPAGASGGFDTMPSPTVAEAVREWLPAFVVRFGSQTYDLTGHTCGIAVHARDANGMTLVILLSAPPSGPAGQSTTVEGRGGSGLAALALTVVTRTGSTVELNLIGDPGLLPSAQTLTKLARDPRLAM